MNVRPTLFVGSSVEGLPIAKAIQQELQHSIDVTLWSQDVFTPSRSTLDTLLETSQAFDLGLFVFSPDDLIEIRGEKHLSVRDNVLFECGLFFGALGRQCSFFLVPRGVEKFHVPTDLWGITPLTYQPISSGGNLQAAVGPACTTLWNTIQSSLYVVDPRLSLNGDWCQTWTIEGSENYPEKNKTTATVKHVGDRFFAVVQGKEQRFAMRGRIKDRYITGEWGDNDRGFFYFGAFQLIVSPTSDRLSGKYVGFRSNNTMGEGDWVWERVPRDRRRSRAGIAAARKSLPKKRSKAKPQK